MQENKRKAFAAKSPATTEVTKAEGSASLATLESSSALIRGEICPSIDYGRPPRLTLVHATSGLAESITPGQWAIDNEVGQPTALGKEIGGFVPITAHTVWKKDFGEDETAPMRFETIEEVENFGGTVTGEPGRPKYSRALELRAVIPDVGEADSTFLRLAIGGHDHVPVVYEASGSAFRSVGAGLLMSWRSRQEVPYRRRWKLGIESRRSRQTGASYFVPFLREEGLVEDERELKALAQLAGELLLLP
jgi:hypothetical protein